jgi:hypothetical protein
VRPSFGEIAEYLVRVGFQILPGVDADAVHAFVVDVDSVEPVLP